MDGNNTVREHLIIKGMARVGMGKQWQGDEQEAGPASRSQDVLLAETCEAGRADNSWELRKGENQAAVSHAPGNIQQG